MTTYARRLVLSAFAIGLALPVTTQAQTIQPITNVNVADGTGYFSDPYNVPYKGDGPIYIAGTTRKYLTCASDLWPNCATTSRMTLDYSALQTRAHQLGADICSVAGYHPYQNDAGLWMMAVTFHVRKLGQCGNDSGATAGWSVIAHAAPTDGHKMDVLPPADWVGDSLTVGSFTDSQALADYDGKYYQHLGQLYLIYSKNLKTNPTRDGIVAQAMVSPDVPAVSAPVTLLAPDDDNPKNSEIYDNGSLKLVETGNIRQIGNKFVLAYSVGAFNRSTYKAAVAWSDTFLPADGQQYRKVTQANPNSVWGTNGWEVVYLLQSEQGNGKWPNYVGKQVIAPGVPTVAQIGPNRSWVLMFAGYTPTDNPIDPSTGNFDASHRRPFYVNLNVNVPDTPSVKDATNAEMVDWIKLAK